uniref:Putative conserved plasma membrane protein n=1 Tax=Corethrella appendiculata TaxID=1370023 RepID=U5ETV9_9DIPT
MTISYTAEVPNGSNFGCFWRILLKWRGSVYKLIWRELLAYLGVYYIINFMYRYALSEDQKRIFERIQTYFGSQGDSIPMSFVLGFYVSLVVKRWWEQYRLLPWPDTLALFISAAIPGNDETGRLMRRNIMRYMILSYVITLQRISLRVKKRFPQWSHLVDAGLMLESERKIFEIMDNKTPMSKYWMPLVWATNIINRARKDDRITSDHVVQTLLMELSDIRRRLGGLIGYDTVCVPLVYTQVVTLVLYTYFIAALMGSQLIPKLDPITQRYDEPDIYFPLFTALQFCFYVGWLKVAEVLINPFGEDDDDIELNWLIDRHIKAAYMIVDEMHEEHPELLKDQYWEEVVPKDLPYTQASEHYRREEPKGSAEHYKVKEADQMYANIHACKKMVPSEDVYADYESVDTPMPERRKGWLGRRLTRMGSFRSSSTAYSSGGLFGRNRNNSVYSSPEAGLTQPITAPQPQKMSLYDRLVGRMSGRKRQIVKQNSKLSLNGAVISSVPSKNRPRIPTPDVAKDNPGFTISTISGVSTRDPGGSNVASGVALLTHQLAQNPSIYPSNAHSDLSVVGTLLLSPIKELDSNSNHNTLQAGHSATAALAKSILPSNIKNSVSAYGKDVTNIDINNLNTTSTSSNYSNNKLNSQRANNINNNINTATPINNNKIIMLPTSAASNNNNSNHHLHHNMNASTTTSHLVENLNLNNSSSTNNSDTEIIPLAMTAVSNPQQFHTTHTNTGTIITELPLDDNNLTTSTITNINELVTNDKELSSSSTTSTLSKRKPKHSEVYV